MASVNRQDEAHPRPTINQLVLLSNLSEITRDPSPPLQQQNSDRTTTIPPGSLKVKGPAPPLLRLPPLIRHGIYRFVGLASWDGCAYTFDLHGGPRRKGSDSLNYTEPYPDRFHGLLLSCRDIYIEAAALLYSANRFVLHYTDPGSLKPLLALTAPVLSSLTALKVVLNQASCHQRIQRGEGCCLHRYSGISRIGSTCEQHAYGHHQLPLLDPGPKPKRSFFSSSPGPEDEVSPAPEGDDGLLVAAQALLSEWYAAASHLSSHMAPRRLELSLVCDIDSVHGKAVDLADSVLEPLRLKLPLLKSCHIRLCKTPDPRLRQVAQDAVLQSCGIAMPYLKPTSTKGTVTLMTLPRELRLRILEFTDLVTPNKEVWWSRRDNKYVWRDIGGGTCYYPIWFDCHFVECWYRTRTEPSVGCFCRRHHAAFSTTCTCWAPPAALFLVCRALYQEVQLVFFSVNRFIVHDHQLSCPWDPDPCREGPEVLSWDYPYERLAASHFLREVIPTHCIVHLRFLELAFPPYLPATWLPTDYLALQDWRETVGWLRDKINGPALTLRLVGADVSEYAPTFFTGPVTVAEGRVLHRAYMDLLQPLKQLADGPDGLARFYASLPYPWESTDESTELRWQGENGRDWIKAKREALKRDAERRVMGDRYDSMYANGKQEPEQSLWQHVFNYHF